MSVAPDPAEIYDRARAEGRRRLDMNLLEQTTTAFIAGLTIVFGFVALGTIEAAAAPTLGGGLPQLLGALGFAIGVVFLIVGRTELFTENFFDPVASAIHQRGAAWRALIRLWVVTLVFNLVGGVVLVAVFIVPGALPAGADHVLATTAEEIAAKEWPATLARAVMAGALLTLLSYMLSAVETVGARMVLAYFVGFLLALGPFDHVVVSALHLLFGIWLGGTVSAGDLASNLGLATVGNVAGGLFLMTFTHSAQARGAKQRSTLSS